MATIQWAQFEAALSSWIATATGLPASSVIFSHQRTPPQPFFALKIAAPSQVGAYDEIRRTDTGTQPAGRELTIVGQRELTVEVQTYSIPEVGPASAKALLSNACTALSRPSVRALFSACGFAYIDCTAVLNLPSLNDEGEGRAQVELRFRAVDADFDSATSIGSIQLTPTWS